MSHPRPHKNLLQPYMHSNLAMTAWTWMDVCIIMGTAPILPPVHESHNLIIPSTAQSSPFHLLDLSTSPRNQIQTQQDSSKPHSLGAVGTTNPLGRRFPKDKPACQNEPLHLGQAGKEPSHPLFNASSSNSLQRKIQITIDASLWKKQSQYAQYQGVWGHYPTVIDGKDTLRILLNNPRCLKLGQSVQSTTYSLRVTEALGVGVLCIAETNVNWDHKGTHAKLHRVVWSIRENVAITTSHIREQFQSENQPGSKITLVTNDRTSCIIERGTDPFGMGRWTYFTLGGS